MLRMPNLLFSILIKDFLTVHLFCMNIFDVLFDFIFYDILKTYLKEKNEYARSNVKH